MSDDTLLSRLISILTFDEIMEARDLLNQREIDLTTVNPQTTRWRVKSTSIGLPVHQLDEDDNPFEVTINVRAGTYLWTRVMQRTLSQKMALQISTMPNGPWVRCVGTPEEVTEFLQMNATVQPTD